jgi:chemotaxis signal transduction protein
MADMAPQGVVVWLLDSQRCALPVHMVERVLPALEITAWAGAPPAVLGSVVLQGRTVGVLDIRHCLGRPQRELQLGDSLVLAHGSKGPLAFFADSVEGVVRSSQADGHLLIDDLSAFLSDAEQRSLAGVCGG